MATFQSLGPPSTLSFLQFDYMNQEMVGLAAGSSAIRSQSSEHMVQRKPWGKLKRGSLLPGFSRWAASKGGFSSEWALTVPQGPHSAHQSGLKGLEHSTQ